ncbi:hypothetical protein, partial [Paenibacillus sp. BJ-4]|uniref:hypothetical protein n=1 Tax=Paenibacillus sp. BJ-4 TaxID=2878097 RepID=UPI001CF0CB77
GETGVTPRFSQIPDHYYVKKKNPRLKKTGFLDNLGADQFRPFFLNLMKFTQTPISKYSSTIRKINLSDHEKSLDKNTDMITPNEMTSINSSTITSVILLVLSFF